MTEIEQQPVVGTVFGTDRDGPVVVATRRVDGTVHIAPIGTTDPAQFADIGWADAAGVVFSPHPDEDADPVMPGERRMQITVPLRDLPNLVGWGTGVNRIPAVQEEVEQQRRDDAHRAYAQRLAAVPTPPGDIVDRIDAAVGELCACGCRRRLHPDGPSPFFASPSCQQRWHSARTTTPEEVYRRPDAAMFVGADQARVPLREDTTHRPALPQALRREGRPVYLDEVPEPCQSPSRIPVDVAYRRACPSCGPVIPLPVGDTPFEVTQFGEDRPMRTTVRIWLQCPHCGLELPGPVYLAEAEHDRKLGAVKFRLTDGHAYATTMVSVIGLTRTYCPSEIVAYEWSRLEREIDRMYRGTPGGAGG